MTESGIDSLAELLYGYGKLNQELRTADAIVALGNMDVRIAGRAAELWHDNLAPVVVTAGGVGRLTPVSWAKPEAVMFAEVAQAAGVPSDKILIEDKSTNIPENIRLAVQLLTENGYAARRLILVALPFAERRILALCKKQFPDIAITMASSGTPYSEFVNDDIDRQESLNLIVGEIDRLRKFPAKGFSVEVDIPQQITDAVDVLIAEGYSKYQVV